MIPEKQTTPSTSFTFVHSENVRNVNDVNIVLKEAKTRWQRLFYQYMMAYKGMDTPRGDLAEDMYYQQTRHPEEGDLNEIDSEERFMNYLSVHRACQACRAVARRCWNSYRKTLENVC